MNRLLCVFSLLISSLSYASCHFNDQSIEIGDTITFLDPVLVAQATQYYRDQGSSETSARQLAETSDWTVIVLECVHSFVPAAQLSASQVGGMIDASMDVLVSIDHQREFLANALSQR